MQSFIRSGLLIFLTTFGFILKGQTLENPAIEVIARRLDDYLVSANKAFRFNGSVLVAKKGNVLLQKGYGWSDVDAKTPNEPDTRFPILSVTKTFTATVILKLQEEGKLSVHDKLAKYFPDYHNGQKIAIHHLLTHSSGIYNYTDDVDIEDSAIVCHPVSKQRILEAFVNKPPEFKPGARYGYNNSGFFLLGLIIEKVTGKPYETVVKEMIFNPLAMTHSGFDFLKLPASIKAKGYEFLDAEKHIPYKHYDSTFAYSAGAIYSTTGDLYQYAKAISSKQILTPDSWKLAFTPKVNQYGYGWQTGQFSGRNYVKHSGGYPGYMSEFIYYPDEDLTIILLNNFGTYEQNVWAVGMGISSIVFNLPYDNWKIRTSVKTDKTVLQQYAGTYELNKKRKLVITEKDGALYMELPGVLKLPLFAENGNLYFLENFNTQILFSKEGGNNRMKLTIHEHGRDSEWVRTE